MSKVKPERHHWWPKCVSRHWADADGGVNWLLPDGSARRSRPHNFGVIGNGHLIKLGHASGEPTLWDQDFESEFHEADTHFPSVIAWLESLEYESRLERPRRARFVPQPSDDEMFGRLLESMVSLAVRSPMTREACVSLAERFRGPLPERERNNLIAINMRDMHRRAVEDLGLRGKATVILSPNREFIFGDGFYHNFVSPSGNPSSPRMLVPLTPSLAVLYARPIAYSTEPRLSTVVIDEAEAEMLNDVVQIYAGNAIFFRSQKPEISMHFISGTHCCFKGTNHIVEKMIHSMPGVPERDISLDFLS